MARASAPDFPPGEILPGTKHRVVRKLAAGGMGVGLEVIKEPQIRGVAKLMGTAPLDDEGFRKRFITEARILAQLEVLDEMLVGHDPFPLQEQMGAEALARATLEAPAERITRDAKWVPERVAAAIARALDKDPEQRLPTALAFLESPFVVSAHASSSIESPRAPMPAPSASATSPASAAGIDASASGLSSAPGTRKPGVSSPARPPLSVAPSSSQQHGPTFEPTVGD